MSIPNIFGKKPDDVLADVGTVLLQIKNERGLTLIDMASVLGRCDDMVSKYIAGESEMGFLAWERATQHWPEFAQKLEETAAERAMRARQRALNFDPIKRDIAA